MDVTLLGIVAVLGVSSLLAFAAGRSRGQRRGPDARVVGAGDRRYGAVAVWLLLGGTIYTAYTFAAVPGLVYGAGAIGFFALAYTIVVYPLAFWMLPRLWSVSAEHGFVTVADYARGRWGSHPLALAIALTGLLATMPYVALQLLGIRAVLEVGGIYPDGLAGDGVLALVFGVLAVATYRSGLRAPALIAVVKCALVVAVAVGVEPGRAGSAAADPVASSTVGRLDGAVTPVAFATSLDPSLHVAYATLALGSAMALLVYPHVLTAAFSASSAAALRRCVIAMPLWTAILAVFGLLGWRRAARVSRHRWATPRRRCRCSSRICCRPADRARLRRARRRGARAGSGDVGRRGHAVHPEHLQRVPPPRGHTATQTRVARVTSLVVKVGALVFVFGLRGQDAINLQLLGGVWILQTFPAVALGSVHPLAAQRRGAGRLGHRDGRGHLAGRRGWLLRSSSTSGVGGVQHSDVRRSRRTDREPGGRGGAHPAARPARGLPRCGCDRFAQNHPFRAGYARRPHDDTGQRTERIGDRSKAAAAMPRVTDRAAASPAAPWHRPSTCGTRNEKPRSPASSTSPMRGWCGSPYCSGAGADAEDVVAEAFCQLYRRWPRLRSPDAAPAYVRGAVVNLVRMRLRHLQVVRRHRDARSAAE